MHIQRVFIGLIFLTLILVGCGGGGSPETFTFDTGVGVITVEEPAGWTMAESFGQISFFNTEDIEAVADAGGIQSGILSGLINVASLRDQTQTYTVRDLVESLPNAGASGTLLELVINDRPAVSFESVNNGISTYSIVTQLQEGVFAIVVVIGEVDTIAEHRDTISQITGSVQFDPTSPN